MSKVTLCRKPGRCCPTVDVRSEDVIIENDDGEKCTIKKDHWEILRQKIKNNKL